MLQYVNTVCVRTLASGGPYTGSDLRRPSAPPPSRGLHVSRPSPVCNESMHISYYIISICSSSMGSRTNKSRSSYLNTWWVNSRGACLLCISESGGISRELVCYICVSESGGVFICWWSSEISFLRSCCRRKLALHRRLILRYAVGMLLPLFQLSTSRHNIALASLIISICQRVDSLLCLLAPWASRVFRRIFLRRGAFCVPTFICCKLSNTKYEYSKDLLWGTLYDICCLFGCCLFLHSWYHINQA